MEMRIISVELRDRDGRPRQIFHAGEAMEIVIDLEAEKDVSDPVVGINIHNDAGQPLYGTNTLRRGSSWGCGGKDEGSLHLSELPFLDGGYAISIGVHSPDDRIVYHWQERAHPFRCINSGPDAGTIAVECGIAVEQL